MLTLDAACRVLGLNPGADREAIRSAFRRRMRELHPDVTGDDSEANQARARDVIEAYRRLCDSTLGLPARRPAAAPPPAEDRTAMDRSWTYRQQIPSPRRVQVAIASALVFGASVFVLFFLVAFSQSGR